MELGLVKKIDIDHEMQQAYLDYAMSVIVARALPDARDGLKPVHRRILYAMHDLGLRPDTPYKKSARIVGEVLGKYHPHGDEAVYDSMARMAQDFSMRYTLVDGQGNFGSVDGDAPAAMRYTEARLDALSMHMLADIQKGTVDWTPNFDDTLKEPSVLPSALPNLLVNGATGIAVGMATSIPPHNLGEVADACMMLLESWERLDDVSVEDVMAFIHGPDFPTGGVILQESGAEGLASAYSTGRGRVIVQARAHLEEMERGRNRIIVTELPYMTNKAGLIERIAELVREERIEGIVDLRDESDRQGMRIVIELSKTAEPEAILRDLYKYTPMQSTFSINMLALVEGEPRLLGLKVALRVYLEHRQEIVRRRSQYDLEKAKARAHILEGLRVALKNLDEVIQLIRKAPDAEAARERLMKRFKLSEIQAQAILDMPLRRLAALERKKIEDEYREVAALIKELEGLLRSPKKMRTVVSEELVKVKEAFADRRRTQIVKLSDGQGRISLLTTADLIPEKSAWITVLANGLVARSREDVVPSLGGKDAPVLAVRAGSRETLYLVTETGEAAAVAVHAIPEADDPQMGAPLHKVCALGEGRIPVGMLSLPARAERKEGAFVLTVSRGGMVKKTELAELPGPSAGTFTLARVNEGDGLLQVTQTDGTQDLLLMTASGMAIRFKEEEVRPMGLVAAGVMGIKLQAGDELVGAEAVPAAGSQAAKGAGEAFLIASDGTGKRVALDQFSQQGRYGQGLQAWKLPSGARAMGMAFGKPGQKIALRIEGHAAKGMRIDAAPLMGRPARGQSVVEGKGLRVLGVVVARGEEQGGGGKTSPPAPLLKGEGRKPAAKKADPPEEKQGKGGKTSPPAPLPRGEGRKPAAKKADPPAEKQGGGGKTSPPAPLLKGEGRKPAAKKPAEQLPLIPPEAPPPKKKSSKGTSSK